MVDAEMMSDAASVVGGDVSMCEREEEPTAEKRGGEDKALQQDRKRCSSEEQEAGERPHCCQSSKTIGREGRSTARSVAKVKSFQASLRCMYLLVFM